MSMDAEVPASDAKPLSLDDTIEHAKRAFALRKYEQAVDHYATALELATEQLGEEAPEVADLYFSYGKALLENAITQAGVLGKQQEQEDDNEPVVAGKAAGGSNQPILSFGGDEEDVKDDDGDATEDPVVDLLGPSSDAPEAEDSGNDDDDEECADGEPEDDFNAAWEVLDLARAIYLKTEAEDDKVKLKLADTYIALGDVSLETEKFSQAIDDYTEGLRLKRDLLPLSSRQLAEAHYKLCIVLDLTGGRLSNAIEHAEGALASVEARIAELRQGPVPAVSSPKANSKGKGKASIAANDTQNMTVSQIEAELKDLTELREDLALKVEELKTLPDEESVATAPELAAKALDQELKGATPTAEQAKFINDLSTMVRKKTKVPPADSSSGKRKAEEEGVRADTPPEKRMKTDD